MAPKDGGDEVEEVVLRVQGIVTKRELPPIVKPFSMYVMRLSTHLPAHLYTQQRAQQTDLHASVCDANRPFIT